MAFRIRHEDDLDENHEINVVPFIDVMLVLLIIFMVAAPLATVDVKVNLPGSTAKQQPRPSKPVYLTIKADKSLVLDSTPVTLTTLAATLKRTTRGNTKTRIYLRADKSIDYDMLMRALNTLRAAGYVRIALVGLSKASS